MAGALCVGRVGCAMEVAMAHDTGSDVIGAAVAAVQRRGSEMLAMTRRWVEVNSFTENLAGVNAVGAMLREAYALPGLTCEVIEGGDGFGDHLVWRTPAAASAAPV